MRGGGRLEGGRYVEQTSWEVKGALCLHSVWNEEQAEGCVKDTKEGQMCSVFLFFT